MLKRKCSYIISPTRVINICGKPAVAVGTVIGDGYTFDIKFLAYLCDEHKVRGLNVITLEQFEIQMYEHIISTSR